MRICLEKIFDDGKLALSSLAKGQEWTFSAVGDYGILPSLMDNIECKGIEPLAEKISELISADVSIANLEVGLTSPSDLGGGGVRGDRDMFMRFHEAAPFTVYSFANNHVRDAGAEELRKTCEAFKSKKIPYVGGGINKSEADSPFFLDCKGVKIGILAFAQKENQIAGENVPGAAELTGDIVLTAAGRLISECDVPIVVLHEGYEFSDFPRPFFMRLCRKLAALGIKLVIGHHSHVPQGIEHISDSLIFYSLGNFLFDQPHFKPYPWTRRSFVPKITFQGTKIKSIELCPFHIELNPLCVRPADIRERAEIFSHLKEITAIIQDENQIQEAAQLFYTKVLLPEFFGFVRHYGNQHEGDFSALIEQFKGQRPVHNVFSDFLEMYGDPKMTNM